MWFFQCKKVITSCFFCFVICFVTFLLWCLWLIVECWFLGFRDQWVLMVFACCPVDYNITLQRIMRINRISELIFVSLHFNFEDVLAALSFPKWNALKCLEMFPTALLCLASFTKSNLINIWNPDKQ